MQLKWLSPVINLQIGPIMMCFVLDESFNFCSVTGSLYVTGGETYRMPTDQADMIEVASRVGKVTALPPMLELRSCHATAAVGSLVFVFGGTDKSGEGLSSCEYFDVRLST